MGYAPRSHSNKGQKKGPWTPEEDFLLTRYIETHGEGQWRTLPKKAGLQRCGKGCRLRWMNYLRPNVKRGNISTEEEELIIRLHKLLGNRWSLIAGRVPGRTDNEIKNYWNTRLSKKLDMGDSIVKSNNVSHSDVMKQNLFHQPNATEIFNTEYVDCFEKKHNYSPARGLITSTFFDGSDCQDSDMQMQHFPQGKGPINIDFIYNPMDALSQLNYSDNQIASSTYQQQNDISYPRSYLVGDLVAVSRGEMPNESMISVDQLKNERATISVSGIDSYYNDRDFMSWGSIFSDQAHFLSTILGEPNDGFVAGNYGCEESQMMNPSESQEFLESCFTQFLC